MSAKDQIEKLGDFILENYPDHVVSGGAGDVAIKVIKHLQNKIDETGIVYCQDCKYCSKTDKYWSCMQHGGGLFRNKDTFYTSKDNYCSWAEEGEEEQ